MNWEALKFWKRRSRKEILKNESELVDKLTARDNELATISAKAETLDHLSTSLSLELKVHKDTIYSFARDVRRLEERLSDKETQYTNDQKRISDLSTDLMQCRLECERLRAELTSATLKADKEKMDHGGTRKGLVKALEYIHASQRLSSPPKGIRGLFAKGFRLSAWAAFLLPWILLSQPASLMRNPWTTNVAGTPVRGQDNLSLTNLGSATNWQFFNVGPKTVARLSDVTNIVSSFASGGIATNANQFLGVPLSLKAGAFQTNGNFFGLSTNHSELWLEDILHTQNVIPIGPDTSTIGALGNAYSGGFFASQGIVLYETGGGLSETIQMTGAADISASYVIVWPDSQGSAGSWATNDGAGNLGWWNGTAVIAQKQFGSANLTNWSSIPTGSMANVVSTTFLTNWANSISNYVTAATNSASVTNWINFRQPASANLTNWSLIPTGSMANVVSTDFLTNWANAISNLTQTKQLGSANLTNWSNIPTGAMANVVSTTFLTNWANAISNLTTAVTNSASVTNWINFRQPASANLTNWSNIPTGSMANVVSTDFLTNWANSISNLTQTKQNGSAVLTNIVATGAITNLNDNQFADETTIASIKDGARLTNSIFFPVGGTEAGLTVTNLPGIGTNSFQILNTNGQAVIFSLTNNGITLVSSNQLVLGPQTNAVSENVAGGVTNWIQTESKGTLYASSNLLVKAGQSTSNAWVGGTIWFDQNGWTNHSAAAGLTNLATNIIAAHVLTNNGDSVHVMWRIKLADSAVNTNQFQIVYGSITVLDTGLQLCSNSTCQADLWVTRTGNTAQHADARFEWGPGSGAPFAFTNNNLELVQTNGIATIFQLKGGARRVGAHTNNWTRVWYDPAIR